MQYVTVVGPLAVSNEYVKAAGIEANIYVLIPPLQYVVADPGGWHCAPDTK